MSSASSEVALCKTPPRTPRLWLPGLTARGTRLVYLPPPVSGTSLLLVSMQRKHMACVQIRLGGGMQ